MNRRLSVLVFILLLAGMASLWGCPKKAELMSAPETQTGKAASSASSAPATETAKAEAKPEIKSEELNEKARSAEDGLKPVYFDFDKSFMRDDAKTVMRANAEWLKSNPKINITIEGNCDERGSLEYNQALGQRRAAGAKKYLADMGISVNRIYLTSFGKDKPVCNEHDESCWQKNRRNDFVVAGE